jgi:hypothetical protein
VQTTFKEKGGCCHYINAVISSGLDEVIAS